MNSTLGIFYLYASKGNIHNLTTDEKILLNIIEIQKIQHPDYILHIDGNMFKMKNVLISRTSTPVNRPTTRGGVYFSDKFEYKIKAYVSELSIVPLLSKSMLGPNTEFKELKITTKIQFENLYKQVILVANLTNSMQSSSNVELNMTIVGIKIENLS